MRALSTRLTNTRITCGDWRRVTKPSVTRATAGTGGITAILLDPPYSTSGDLYAHGDNEIAHTVGDWCASETTDGMRVIISGYNNDHDQLLGHGWTKIEGRATSAGYNKDGKSGRRERLWCSPECVTVPTQHELFEA